MKKHSNQNPPPPPPTRTIVNHKELRKPIKPEQIHLNDLILILSMVSIFMLGFVCLA